MATELQTGESTDSTVDHPLGTPGAFGAGALVAAAAAFFAGGGIVFTGGDPGATTPLHWTTSHALWFAASALLTSGIAALLRDRQGLRAALAGPLALGGAALATVQGLVWTTWVYGDVMAYRNGHHDVMLDGVFHPVGAGLGMAHGLLLGGVVALLGWAIVRAGLGPRIGRAGVVVGALAVALSATSVVVVAPVESPPFVAAVLSQALVYVWVLALGVVEYRRAE